jgi:hypothetical protein
MNEHVAVVEATEETPASAPPAGTLADAAGAAMNTKPRTIASALTALISLRTRGHLDPGLSEGTPKDGLLTRKPAMPLPTFGTAKRRRFKPTDELHGGDCACYDEADSTAIVTCRCIHCWLLRTIRAVLEQFDAITAHARHR